VRRQVEPRCGPRRAGVRSVSVMRTPSGHERRLGALDPGRASMAGLRPGVDVREGGCDARPAAAATRRPRLPPGPPRCLRSTQLHPGRDGGARTTSTAHGPGALGGRRAHRVERSPRSQDRLYRTGESPIETHAAARPRSRVANSDEPRRRGWHGAALAWPPTGSGAHRDRASAPRVDPRISARRAEVTRRQGRRRLAVLVAVVVLAGAASVWFLLHTPISRQGGHRRGAVPPRPPRSPPPPALRRTRPPRRQHRAAARPSRLCPGSDAQVRRSWPDGVGITLTERTPAAVVAHTGASTWSRHWQGPGQPASAPAACPPRGARHRAGAGASLSRRPPPGSPSSPACRPPSRQVSTVSVDATARSAWRSRRR